MQFSILIPSLASRGKQRSKLIEVLEQHRSVEVEILTDIDNGIKPIGQKRNDLLRRSSGDYVAFIDDDDMVSDDYVPRILEGIGTGPDCIGMKVEMTSDGNNPEIGICSIQNKKWYSENDIDNPGRKIYYRTPHHLCPVRREIALSVGFPETNHGEDREYSIGILPQLKSEFMINKVLYYYLYDSKKPKRR